MESFGPLNVKIGPLFTKADMFIFPLVQNWKIVNLPSEDLKNKQTLTQFVEISLND